MNTLTKHVDDKTPNIKSEMDEVLKSTRRQSFYTDSVHPNTVVAGLTWFATGIEVVALFHEFLERSVCIVPFPEVVKQTIDLLRP